MDLSHSTLYRMPFSMTDNPIGWLEVTDHCNITCRGCYRSRMEGHRPLEELQKEIRFFREHRNCDNISVAGGEPTVHPQIAEIARTIRDEGMKCVLVTNGVLLDYDNLSRLRDAGVTHLGLHIDQFQNRPGYEDATEEDLMEVRQYFADLCEQVGDVNCTIGMTVFRENLDIVPRIVDWARDNMGKVTGMVFITYRAVPLSDDLVYTVGGKEVPAGELNYVDDNPQNLGVTSEMVAQAIYSHEPEYQPGAYLNGTVNHLSNKYLMATRVGRPGRIFGYVGPRTMELAEASHHLRHGRYMAFVKSPRQNPAMLSAGLVDPFFRPALRRWVMDGIKHPRDAAGPVYTQSLTIVQAPDYDDASGHANMCDSCPDMTIHEGRLVNSCRLDELRKWGGFIQIHRRPEA